MSKSKRANPAAGEVQTDRRMIEFKIPLEEVNYASGKEKKHPRRFVELIHQWPARRPRSASRVAVAAALMQAPQRLDELAYRYDLLKKLAPYECDSKALEEARALIKKEHGGRAPKVLDIFAGGGAIPLEAANLGCEAHAVELNPVAHIIELATCVYPQRYGTKLADLVEKWGKTVLERVRAEIGDLYPKIRLKKKAEQKLLVFASGDAEAEGEVEVEPIAYLWTRTVPCVNRDCGATVPLVRQTWLCRKEHRSVALKPVKERDSKTVRYEIVSAASADALGFDPADHSDRGDAECIFCGATIDADRVKVLGRDGKVGTQLMAVAGLVQGQRGRVYLPAESADLPEKPIVKERLALFKNEWPGPADVPLAPNDAGGSCIPYGLDRYWKLFTDRQAVALLTISRIVRAAHAEIARETGDPDLARAVTTYLALATDKAADGGCSLTRWQPKDQIVIPAVSRQALPIVWDFAEVNPFASVLGGLPLILKNQVSSIRGLSDVGSESNVIRGSATDLPFADASFDGVVTDPPYYDSISYADLSDFFYVWIKRTIGELYPDHLSADQTPKKHEATVVPYRHDGDDARAREHYKTLMTTAFREAGRVVRPGAPVVVVYAHKTVAGWGSLVDALREAHCSIHEAWPLKTEAEGRLRSINSAALASSIFLVARKRTAEVMCDDYDEKVIASVREVVAERVDTLWEAGIRNTADLVVAVMGAALKPFTSYSKVYRPNGREVRTDEFLDDMQRVAIEAILKKIIRESGGGDDVLVSGIDAISRLYVVARLQFGDAATEFDTLKNLAIGALPPGTELDGMRGALMHGARALLAKKGGKVTLRSFEERGKEQDLGLSVEGKPAPLIDVLHRLLWLQRNRPSEIADFIQQSGADLNAVRLVAVALGGRPLRAEPRPGAQKDERTDEQRVVDTFLASFDGVARSASATPLFDGGSRKKEKKGERT